VRKFIDTWFANLNGVGAVDEFEGVDKILEGGVSNSVE
jgi:hypothetical protein